MPLYKLSPAGFCACQEFFNRHASDGLIGKQQLRGILSKRGIDCPAELLNDIIASVSIDDRGINLQCYVDLVSSYKNLRDKKQELVDAFSVFDVEGKGVIRRQDLEKILGDIASNIDVKSLMETLDTDGNGLIDFEEFQEIFKKTN